MGTLDEAEHLHDDVIEGDGLNIELSAILFDILNGMLGTAWFREYQIAV